MRWHARRLRGRFRASRVKTTQVHRHLGLKQLPAGAIEQSPVGADDCEGVGLRLVAEPDRPCQVDGFVLPLAHGPCRATA